MKIIRQSLFQILLSLIFIVSTTSKAEDPKELVDIREKYEKELQAAARPIYKRYLSHLEQLKRTYAQEFRIQDALTVENEMKTINELLTGGTNPNLTIPVDNVPLIEQEKKIVTLIKPYAVPYAGAPTDRLSVQYAVIEIANQAGLKYDWGESYKNTNPVCRTWVYPHIKNKTFRQAMLEILNPVGLTYKIQDGSIVILYKK